MQQKSRNSFTRFDGVTNYSFLFNFRFDRQGDGRLFFLENLKNLVYDP